MLCCRFHAECHHCMDLAIRLHSVCQGRMPKYRMYLRSLIESALLAASRMLQCCKSLVAFTLHIARCMQNIVAQRRGFQVACGNAAPLCKQQPLASTGGAEREACPRRFPIAAATAAPRDATHVHDGALDGRRVRMACSRIGRRPRASRRVGPAGAHAADRDCGGRHESRRGSMTARRERLPRDRPVRVRRQKAVTSRRRCGANGIDRGVHGFGEPSGRQPPAPIRVPLSTLSAIDCLPATSTIKHARTAWSALQRSGGAVCALPGCQWSTWSAAYRSCGARPVTHSAESCVCRPDEP